MTTLCNEDKVPLIIDAGFAARFFAIAYPQARILSVEPDHANAAICRMNTSEPDPECIRNRFGRCVINGGSYWVPGW